jgi:putative oxidoreductase
MVLTSLTKYREFGLLLLRVSLGGLIIYAHGWHDLGGGTGRWREMGHAMYYLHIHFAPVMWGFLAAFAETVGAALLVIGYFFRPACILLALTALVLSIVQWKLAGHFAGAAHDLELLAVFVSLILIGPGKYSADKS